jgi:hypothetical protein
MSVYHDVRCQFWHADTVSARPVAGRDCVLSNLACMKRTGLQCEEFGYDDMRSGRVCVLLYILLKGSRQILESAAPVTLSRLHAEVQF